MTSTITPADRTLAAFDVTSAGAAIPIESVPNLRDLGGWPTPHGRVRRGLVYRSAQFSDLSGADATAFAELGVRTVFDLRTTDERIDAPSILPEGMRPVIVDVLRDAPGRAPSRLLDVLAVLDDATTAEELLGGGKTIARVEASYRALVTLPSAREGYHRLYTQLGDRHSLPASFHCPTGADRTGWGAAALLLLLGVDYGDVVEEYLLTNEQLLPTLRPVVDRFAAEGGDPGLLLRVLGARREYLDGAYDEMTTTYGDIEAYFTDGLFIDGGAIARLRELLIEPTSSMGDHV